MTTQQAASTRGDDPLVVEGEPYESFVVEQRGIDHIPEADRHMTPGQLGRMWGGAVTNIATLSYGTILMSLGLSFAQAAWLIVLGNLSYVLVGVAGVQGPKAGTSSFTISRAAYGSNGSKGLSAFNWLTMLGFEATGLALIVLAGSVLVRKAGFVPGTPAKVVLCIVAGALLAVLPIFGHATITRVLRTLLIPFVALFVIFAVLTINKANLHSVPHGAGWGTLMVGLAIVISSSGLGWANEASDFSRYMPSDTKASKVIAAGTLGCLIPQTFLMLIGALVGTVVTTGTNPVTNLPQVFPGWFLVPYLVVGIAQMLAVTTMNTYSSGLTLQSMGLRLKRTHAVALDIVICTVAAIFVVFSSSFNKVVNDFLLFIIVWLAPWIGIYLVDWALRRGRYDGVALVSSGKSRYYVGRSGVRMAAAVAQVGGMVASFLWLNAYPVYVGPLSSRISQSDFSIPCGVVVASVLYWLLARKTVRAEGEALAPVR